MHLEQLGIIGIKMIILELEAKLYKTELHCASIYLIIKSYSLLLYAVLESDFDSVFVKLF